MLAEPSPFPHQGPLEPEQVRGRDHLVADLVARVTSRRVTALVGPRRYGKTSLLRRVAAEVAAGGASVVWVDLYEATSTADLARRFDSALAEARGPVGGTLAAIAARFDLQLGLLGVQLSRRRDERPDPEASFDSLLETLVAGARQTPTVVVVDELPGIDRVEGAAGLLRTKLQHHVQEIGLIFAGSQPSLMRAMFTERSRPFYAQPDLVEIGPFSAAAIAEIVSISFEAFTNNDMELAYHVEPLGQLIGVLCDEVKLHHINRVQSGACTLNLGFIFNDLLTNYERVSDHCSNIAASVIEMTKSGRVDTHQLVRELRSGASGSQFQELYQQYVLKYSIPRQ